ncbi:non-ribosomal peptide synthetase, partial [Microbulbifer epialgicus]
FNEGRENPLGPLSVQYADYAVWQREWLSGDVLAKQLGYWQEQLRGLPPVHSLPLDKSRPEIQNFEGKSISRVLEKSTLNEIIRYCNSNNVTLFMFLQSALSILINKYSYGQNDIVMGTPIAGRAHTGVESIIGFFVNTLVLRSNVEDNLTFEKLLQNNRSMILDAYAHQDIPFELLVETVNPERNLSYSPLFQVMINLRNSDQVDLNIDGIDLENNEFSEGYTKYDIELSILEVDEELSLTWIFNNNIFEYESIERIAKNFNILIDSILKGPARIISQLKIMDDSERKNLLHHSENPNETFLEEDCFLDYFESQVAKSGDAIAVIYGDNSLTYDELNKRSNQVARYLIDKGVKTNDLVGVCVSPSLEVIISLLGVLKSGAAYVPLDPQYPKERIMYMLEDSSACIVLTKNEYLKNLCKTTYDIISVDDSYFVNNLKCYPETNLSKSLVNSRPDSLAYVIYTSGSTGMPKGVMVDRKNLSNFLKYSVRNFISNDIEGSIVSSSIAFDATVCPLYVPLCVGKSVNILGVSDNLLSELAETLTCGPYLYKITPSHIYALKGYFKDPAESRLKHVFVIAGEPLSKSICQYWVNAFPKSIVINEYGPTEATVGSSTFNCNDDYSPETSVCVPIGRPLSNVKLFIFDENSVLCPLGSVGELHIGGAGVARGYLNRPELTK